MKVRTAHPADLTKLLEFEQGIITAERAFTDDLKEGNISYYDLESFLDDPLVEVLVVEYEGKLIASSYARIKKSKPYLSHDRYSYLGFMYVDPNFRGHGINKMLIERLKEWSLTKGVKEMRLEVYFENSSAIRAYEKAGFHGHMLEMRLTLD